MRLREIKEDGINIEHFAPVVVPFINSDQMRHEEEITEKRFQITKRNVKCIFQIS